MIIKSTNEKLNYEFFQIAKQFFPYEQSYDRQENELFITKHSEVVFSHYVDETIEVRYGKKHFFYKTSYNFNELGLSREKEITRFAKMAYYSAMVHLTKKELDWGCLTGVRPTKIAYEIFSQTNDYSLASKRLQKLYGLSPKKADLVCDIISAQNEACCKLIDNDKTTSAIFYINIPFCTSKCSYCSFISAVIGKCQELVEPMVEALKNEITETKKWIDKNNVKIKSVYMGGGTPTSLSAKQLDEILQCCKFGDIEFTVEAGRPDTITREKLEVLKKHNVSRISINPQTFNQEVLNEIGRSHSVKDVYEKFNLAKEMGFTINMDLIAGLPKDDYKSFKFSLNEAIKLAPDNITIHTLALKSKAMLIKDENFVRTNATIKKMVDYANKSLREHGYIPYYIYRQKNMLENQENVGWSKPNKLCKYNIDSMEDFDNVIACGANSVSKRIFPSETRIERCDCPKDIKTYIEKVPKLIENKRKFFID